MENRTTLTPFIKNKLVTTITWARYAAIISFVNLGLGFLQLLIGGINANISFVGPFVSFLISGLITLVMSINLLNYSKHAQTALRNEDSTHLYQSLYHLRIYFIIMGTLFLIIIGLLVLFIIFAVISYLISIVN